jgi:hypothetical protein
VAVITAAGGLLYARLDEIGETVPEEMEAAGTALGSAFAVLGAEPTLGAAQTLGLPYVAMTADSSVFIETRRQADTSKNSVGLATPWAPVTSMTEGSYTLTQWFANAYLARVEFPFQDMGDPKSFKNFLEVQLTLERSCRAYVGIYAETDSGRRGGRWKGLVFPSTTIRVPINLFGHALRLRIVAVVFNAGRFVLRDVTVGYTQGGAD